MRIFFQLILVFSVVYFFSACQKQSEAETVSASTNVAVSTPSRQPAPDSSNLMLFDASQKQTENSQQALNEFLTGFWKRDYLLEEPRRSEFPSDVYDCPCNECLDIQFERVDESFCVAGNQIWVSAYFVLDEKNEQVKLYFKEPTDLGNGGAGLSWKKYDRKEPLAVIDISKAQQEKQIRVEWLGFSINGKKQKDRYGELYEGIYYKQ